MAAHPRQEATWLLTCGLHILQEAAGVPPHKAHPALLCGHPIPWDPNLQGDGLTLGMGCSLLATCALASSQVLVLRRHRKTPFPSKPGVIHILQQPKPGARSCTVSGRKQNGDFLPATLAQGPPPALPDKKSENTANLCK